MVYRLERLFEYECVVNFAPHPLFGLFYDCLELGLVVPRQVILLKDSCVSLNFESGFIIGNFRSMYRSHARFLSEQVNDSFIGVSTWSHPFGCSVDHIFVDGALVESLILAKSANVGLTFICVLKPIHWLSLIRLQRVVEAWGLLFRIPKLKKCSSHLYLIQQL